MTIDEKIVAGAFGIVGVFLGAVLASASNFGFKSWELRSHQRSLTTVLVGELINIRQHYFYVENELPESLSSIPDAIALKMSRYDKLVFSGKDIADLGFLTDNDITDLMQLSLRVRNTDLYIDALLREHERGQKGFQTELKKLKDRVGHVRRWNSEIGGAIVSRNPNLRKLWAKNSFQDGA